MVENDSDENAPDEKHAEPRRVPGEGVPKPGTPPPPPPPEEPMAPPGPALLFAPADEPAAPPIVLPEPLPLLPPPALAIRPNMRKKRMPTYDTHNMYIPNQDKPSKKDKQYVRHAIHKNLYNLVSHTHRKKITKTNRNRRRCTADHPDRMYDLQHLYTTDPYRNDADHQPPTPGSTQPENKVNMSLQ